MNKLRVSLLLLFVLFAPRAFGFNLQVGANVDVINFFYLPKGTTGVSTSGNFGLGSVYAGLGLGKWFAARVVLGTDNTGTITASGANLFGQSLNASGKFKVFLTSVEAFLNPPFFPLYLKAGIGVGKLSTDLPAPFNQLTMKAAVYGGLGITFTFSKLQFSGGLDLVYVMVNTNSSGLNVSGLPYFRVPVGLTYTF